MKLQDYISQTLIATAENTTIETDVELDISVFVQRDPYTGETIHVEETSANRVKFTILITPKKEQK